MNKGFPATVISKDILRPADADFAGGYIVQSLGVVPGTFATQVARGRCLFGHELTTYLDRYNHLAGIGINGDCVPSPQNFLEVSSQVDTPGDPQAPHPL